MTRAAPWILGVSASHNGAACLLHGNDIFCAVQEERLSRVKRDRIDGSRPSLAIEYCLAAAGIGSDALDLVVLCTQESKDDSQHDIRANPQLQAVVSRGATMRISHHLGHAVSALALSGEREAAVLVVDGAGSPHADLSGAEQAAVRTSPGWESISLYKALDGELTSLEKHSSGGSPWLGFGGGMPTFSTLGGMYSAVAVQLFGDPLEAGKVMGLAPLGRPTTPVKDFFEWRDGLLAFNDVVPQRYRHDDRWPAHRRDYADLARSVQEALEAALLPLAARLRGLTGCDALCYAGGVALNGIANERLWREAGYERIYIPAAAEDSGTAIGAAYHGLWQLTRFQPRRRLDSDRMGRAYSTHDVTQAVAKTPFVRIASDAPTDNDRNLVADVAQRLADRQIGGWFEGGSELGPRALGQRSILADPRWADAKTVLNDRIKRREDFRPFAPAILLGHAAKWFDCGPQPRNPFMLRIWKFKSGLAARTPAVAHVDGSGRAQTIDGRESPVFHALVERFERLTGIPFVLNTSFNGPGEPIVETPEDALWCMLENDLDFVVLNDCLVERATAQGDLLTLVPYLTANLGAGRGEPRSDRPDGRKIHYHVETPWGRSTQRLVPEVFPVLSFIDGRRTGVQIDCILADGPVDHRAAGTLRQLMTLRRKRVIGFRENSSASASGSLTLVDQEDPPTY